MKFFEVGGCIRDEILGLKTKDIDFAVDMTEDFSDDLKVEDMFMVMKAKLMAQGFEGFTESPENFTWRAKVPNGHPLENRTRVADFVMCRKEGPYSDGRHPDWVKIGDIFDDLSRRDFTMNAIARDIDGNILDPHGGVSDIARKTIRFVGDPEQRIREDGLRVLRALRFVITKGFDLDWQFGNEFMPTLYTLLVSGAEALDRPSISDERIREELDKMVKFDTLGTLKLLEQFPRIRDVIFSSGKIRFDATMKKGS